MATFDRERREIVLRIVYDGAATAGKTANLQSLRACFGLRARGEVYAPAETATGRTLYFDSLELATGNLDEWSLRCQVLTVPGQFALAERRYQLLRGIDAAVVVCESTPRGVQAARSAWSFLSSALASLGGGPVPVVIQANKQDLPGALSPAQVEAMLVDGRSLQVLPASAIHGDGVRATFLAALDAARRVTRERMGAAGPEALGPPLESAEKLYEAMVREEEGTGDPGAACALDGALALVQMGETPRPPPHR